jgi:hypothetical protein
VGLFLFPRYANTDDLSTGIFYGISLILFLLAIIGLWTSLLRRRRNRSSEAPAKSARSRSGLRTSIIYLFIGLLLVASPKEGSINNLVDGIFYGTGLTISLMAILGLCSTLGKRPVNKALPKQ